MKNLENLKSESSIKVIGQETVFEGRFIKVVVYKYMKGNDPKPHLYEVVERKNLAGIVTALTVTEDEKVILINQYRIPQGRFCIESPAGLQDKENESLEETARREILEETGYEPQELVYVGKTPTSSGLTTEVIDCFIGLNCKKVSEVLALDNAEDIQVLEIPLNEMDEFVKQVRERVDLTIDSKVLFMLAEYKKLKAQKDEK